MTSENAPPAPAENALAVLQQMVGRPLLSPQELLKKLHQADWPDICYVHSADFLALSSIFALAKDDEGVYFTLANTQVRPQGSDKTLDLSDYQGPDRVVSATWGK